MNFIDQERLEKSPYVQLLTLGLYAIAGIILASLASVLSLYFWYGEMFNADWLNPGHPKNLVTMRIFIGMQQIGLFLLPALVLAWGEKQRVREFYGFKKVKVELMLLVILMMVFSMPILEWVTMVNMKMVLPGFLKPVEEWMRAQEDKNTETMVNLLKINHIGDYLISILLIAILPAIAEEMIFRGAIQRSLGRMFKNPHFVIWFTAFIFSAIHIQFYGFLPRLLLGAAFGYIYFWTQSLWYSMFAHFVNNAYAVTGAWYMQKNNIPLSEANKTTNFQWYGVLISVILTFLVFKYFKNKSLKADGKQLDKSI